MLAEPAHDEHHRAARAGRFPGSLAMTLATVLSGLSACGGASVRTLESQAYSLTTLALSRSGRFVALGCWVQQPAPRGAWPIEMWDLESGARHSLPGHSDEVNALAFSADEKRLFSGGRDRTLRVWDVATASLSATHEVKGEVSWLGALPEARLVLALHGRPGSDTPPRLDLWDVEARRPAREEPARMLPVALSADGKRLARAVAFLEVEVLGLPEWQPVGKVQARGERDQGIASLALSADGGLLAIGTRAATVEVWDLAAGRSLWLERAHLSALFNSRPVVSVAFSPSGRLLASVGGDETVKVWRVRDGTQLQNVTEFTRLRRLLAPPKFKKPVAIAITPDEKTLLVGYQDRRVEFRPLPPVE
jgi:WD40 repeat protein